MTRKSKRELERILDELADEDSPDSPDLVVLNETVAGTEWEGSDLDPDETVETTERVEL